MENRGCGYAYFKKGNGLRKAEQQIQVTFPCGEYPPPRPPRQQVREHFSSLAGASKPYFKPESCRVITVPIVISFPSTTGALLEDSVLSEGSLSPALKFSEFLAEDSFFLIGI